MAIPLPDALQRLLRDAERLRAGGRRGRYAPSPTGALHLGNLRTALVSWLITRMQGGEWLLRLDDLDTPRNRVGAEASILEDLRWLGLHWDGAPIRQSERRGLYATVLSSLRRAGRLYPCRCSRRLLADISAPHGRTAVYPGFCRERQPCWGPLQGRLPSWRLRLDPGWLTWDERLAPEGRLDAGPEVGDVVLRRADGFLAYHLATAVDELSLGISDVVRGDDLWAATAPQVAVIRLLGAEPPRYWHAPLLLDAGGERLSKRQGGIGLMQLRERGCDGPAVVGLLAGSLNLVPAGSRISSAELLQQMEPETLRRALIQTGSKHEEGLTKSSGSLAAGLATLNPTPGAAPWIDPMGVRANPSHAPSQGMNHDANHNGSRA
jgi:glutamyl-tRNA synthetase